MVKVDMVDMGVKMGHELLCAVKICVLLFFVSGPAR